MPSDNNPAAGSSDLIERLRDEQHRRCCYGTRDGDGRTCDCKYAHFLRPATSETTGCPELRAAIRVLSEPPALDFGHIVIPPEGSAS